MMANDHVGNLRSLNDLARDARANYIIHTGDFGFYDDRSLDRIAEKYVFTFFLSSISLINLTGPFVTSLNIRHFFPTKSRRLSHSLLPSPPLKSDSLVINSLYRNYPSSSIRLTLLMFPSTPCGGLVRMCKFWKSFVPTNTKWITCTSSMRHIRSCWISVV